MAGSSTLLSLRTLNIGDGWMTATPHFLLAKRGITSSCLASHAPGVKRAMDSGLGNSHSRPALRYVSRKCVQVSQLIIP